MKIIDLKPGNQFVVKGGSGVVWLKIRDLDHQSKAVRIIDGALAIFDKEELELHRTKS